MKTTMMAVTFSVLSVLLSAGANAQLNQLQPNPQMKTQVAQPAQAAVQPYVAPVQSVADAVPVLLLECRSN